MSLILVVVLVAVGVGYLTGGRLQQLAQAHLTWWPLALVAVALQAVPPPSSQIAAVALLLGSYVALGAVAIRNIRQAGMWLVAAGLLANVLVIGVNGSMPVSIAAVEASGQVDAANALAEGETDLKHERSEDAALGFLSDVIPVPPPFAMVISVGDILLYAGIGWFVVGAMRGREEPAADEELATRPP